MKNRIIRKSNLIDGATAEIRLFLSPSLDGRDIEVSFIVPRIAPFGGKEGTNVGSILRSLKNHIGADIVDLELDSPALQGVMVMADDTLRPAR